MDKVKYRCKGCGWSKELPLEWGDIKPRYCPTPTCEMSIKKSKGVKSFRNLPDKLEVTYTTTKEQKGEESEEEQRIQRRPQNSNGAVIQRRASPPSREVSPKEDSPKED